MIAFASASAAYHVRRADRANHLRKVIETALDTRMAYQIPIVTADLVQTCAVGRESYASGTVRCRESYNTTAHSTTEVTAPAIAAAHLGRREGATAV